LPASSVTTLERGLDSGIYAFMLIDDNMISICTAIGHKLYT
jgi:hypothetical protein